MVDRPDRRDGRDRQDEIDPHEHDEHRRGIADAEQHMPSGIQAIGAIGASPRTMGIGISVTSLEVAIGMPVRIAAANDREAGEDPQGARDDRNGIVIASPPKPTRNRSRSRSQ